ncbi:beta-glucosidase family protein [Entomobacter blattae]|uniref:Thermostable beta-glucosidase B n=1 Tax=Entomobacter blattae TaxID=2762277 RepID=A0A7H1NNX3_9PROT|nr:glycoside hydrolase family 3 protein [Entomobacter blattae]QNT77483.1 Thermostable beta-glucosidase B [Entomobacter blattae]
MVNFFSSLRQFFSTEKPFSIPHGGKTLMARGKYSFLKKKPLRPSSSTKNISQIIDRLTLEEKIALLSSQLAIDIAGIQKPPHAIGSAGFCEGNKDAAIPALQITDAGLGVGITPYTPYPEGITALPSTLTLAASFSSTMAEKAGNLIGKEASLRGFNVLLLGGCNLVREPLSGRNFETAGEDPLLSGHISGALARGVQNNKVVAALKHFVLSPQETRRAFYNATLNEEALQESDLLAFYIALGTSHAGAVMLCENRVNDLPMPENSYLVTTVLKKEWGFSGWVLSEWGSTPSCEPSAIAGLDQESARELDKSPYFTEPLLQAVQEGRVPLARIDDMVERILKGLAQAGLFPAPSPPPQPLEPNAFTADMKAHYLTARSIAEKGIVLLKNDNECLPLPFNLTRIALIGGHADLGILSGGGSSQVTPPNSLSFEVNAQRGHNFPLQRIYHPSVPLLELRKKFSSTEFVFHDGTNVKEASQIARDCDAAIIFAEQWMSEGLDSPNLELPDQQDILISSIALANPKTIVVLITGGAVKMPWVNQVGAILAAWYPGIAGAEAIARIISGEVTPSGRLPISFPHNEDQLPNPTPIDITIEDGNFSGPGPFDISYKKEGSNVGYRWFSHTKQKPLFPFGFGLSYTSFHYSDLMITEQDETLVATLDIVNTGQFRGTDVPQIYVSHTGRTSFSKRLIGYYRINLEAGQGARISIVLEKKILAHFHSSRRQWHIEGGRYAFTAAPHADDDTLQYDITLSEEYLPIKAIVSPFI